jgi:hypothetical protein
MKVNKILFVHPSRGRPEMAFDAFASVTQAMRSGTKFNYIMCLDADDATRREYWSKSMSTEVDTIVSDNPHEVVSATNHGARMLDDEDLLICNQDDYRWTEGWDMALIALLEKLPAMALVYCPDYNPTIALPYIMTASLYRRLGYMVWPEYISMYADNDILEVARKLGCAYDLRPMPLTHIHPDFGCRPMDETTARTNEASKMEHGRKILAARRLRGFDL